MILLLIEDVVSGPQACDMPPVEAKILTLVNTLVTLLQKISRFEVVQKYHGL